MQQVTVSLNERSYPIYIGPELLEDASSFLQQLGANRRIFVISNTTVAPLYLEKLQQTLAAQIAGSFLMPDGEAHKSLETFGQALDAAIECNLHRDSLIVALGGGVVGDLAGFVAATLHRGVDFVQIPTTLLAQVDSSVGGKTAVNHQLGKNLIGAFHQPCQVLIDISTLDTLPAREFKAGIAEIIKYGVIYDAAFFAWLEQNMDALLARNTDTLIYAIQRSCEIKAEIVANDEREHGQRALLNFGHTFGHVIENAMGYGQWLHGEAVATGMVIATHLAAAMQWCEVSEFRRVRALIAHAGLPTEAPILDQDTWTRGLFRDKKVKNNVVRFILPTGIGSAQVTQESLSKSLIHASIASATAGTTSGGA